MMIIKKKMTNTNINRINGNGDTEKKQQQKLQW
jgi:hypothetical protein